MIRRFAAVSALVLAALALSPAAQAQGFFSFYEISPQDVLSRLDEQGYTAHVPMIRHGEVYVVDARTSSGRAVRLIVSARDGAILERFAATPRYEDFGRTRWRDEDFAYRRGGDDDEQDERPERRPQAALADPHPPRVVTLDGSDRVVPPAAIPDPGAPEAPHRRTLKKATAPATPDASGPSVAAVAPSDPKPATPAEARPAPAKVIDLAPAKPVAAPAKPEVKIVPAPATQAKVEAPKPKAPRIVGEPMVTSQPKSEDKPAPVAEAPKAAPAQARADEKPKPEAPRKKLNDLPVGTLD